MFHGSGHAIGFIVIRHIVCLSLDGWCGIAHRNTDSCSFNDRKVVFRVADCHRFIRINRKNFGERM